MDTEKYDHYAYGLMLATKLKSIKHTEADCHFFKATAEDFFDDFQNRVSEANGTILIAINPSDSKFDWKNSDSLVEQPNYLFAILQATNSTDTQTIYNALSNTKDIGIQIISKMMQDSSKYTAGLNYLINESFEMRGYGPIGDNFYGVLISFFLERGISYKLNTDMWED